MSDKRSMALHGGADAPAVPAIDPHAFIGKKPNKVVPVPKEFQRQTFTRERTNLINEVKVQTNSVVLAHWDNHGKIYQFDIFGAGQGVEKAVRCLNHWISNAHTKSKATTAWAKTSAFDHDQWYYDRVDEWEDERKQKFKGQPPEISPGEIPLPKIFVDWPQELVEEGLSPRDAFGNKLEALDRLRMQDEVYISLLPIHGGRWGFEITGYDIIYLEAAEEHIHTMINKVRVEARGQQHTLNVILDYKEGIEVQLEQHESWWPNQTDRVVPRLLSSAIMDHPGSFRRDVVDSSQLDKIQNEVQRALEVVRHRKGAYDFTIRLGCLALSSRHVKDEKIRQIFPKDKFLKEINGPIELDVKKWLADDDVGYRILRRLMAAETFLEPTKSSDYFGYMPESLEKTRPTLRGTWVFRDPSRTIVRPTPPERHAGRPTPLISPSAQNENTAPSPETLFVVQVDWTDDETGRYEKGAPRFYKLEPGKTGPKKNMDINLLELGQSRGWQFALESLIPLAKKSVSPVLAGFVDRVTMKPKYDFNSTESFARWDMTPTMKQHFRTGRLDQIYSFGIKKTCYKLEFAVMWYAQQPQQRVWGLGVRHTEWAQHLVQLEQLSLGGQADWGDTLSTFFPEDGQFKRYDMECPEFSRNTGYKNEDLGIGDLDLESDGEKLSRTGFRILVVKLLQISELVHSAMGEGGILI